MNNNDGRALSPEEKRRLLLQRLQQKAEQTATNHPLSPHQEGLFFLAHLQPESVSYNMPYTLKLYGDLNEAVLERSLSEIIRRHGALRTVFRLGADGIPYQIVQPFAHHPLEVVQLTGLTDDHEHHATMIVNQEATTPFSITEGPLFRYRLVRLSATESWLIFVFHHLVFDLLSMGVLFDDLQALYRAFLLEQPVPLKELTLSYTHIARWQRQILTEETQAHQLAYWSKKLGGSLPLLDLPTDFARPSQPSGKGALYPWMVPSEVAEGLRDFARQAGVSLFQAMLAAWSMILHHYTRQDDILIGTPVSLRNRAETMQLIGLLINTSVIRADLSAQPTFRQLVQQIRATMVEALSHQDVPFLKIVQTLQPDRQSGRTPIFQTMFVLEQVNQAVNAWPNIEAVPVAQHHGTAKFDLALIITERDGELHALFEYSTDLFEQATLERLAQHCVQGLRAALANPDQPVGTLSLLSTEEETLLYQTLNDTARPYPTHTLIHEYVRQQAITTPWLDAVVDAEQRLTYAELNTQSDQLATVLRRYGVGPNRAVAVVLERSCAMIVTLFAIMKAGGAYVPIDPTYPDDRVEFIIEDSRAIVVCTQSQHRLRLAQHTIPILCVDQPANLVADTPPPHSSEEPRLDTLAYIIYTSGSTGKPKGVAVTHASMLNYVQWHIETYQLSPRDHCSQVLSAGFDPTVMEIWPTLTAGACLFIVDDPTRLAPKELRDWLIRHQITLGVIPTTLAQELMHLSWPETTMLRAMLIGGEKLLFYPPQLPFQVVNHYGPTECTIVTTSTMVPPRSVADNRLPSIGKPMANTQVYVLNHYGAFAPYGVAGELCVGGAGLAQGYYHRDDLTHERFVQLPINGVMQRVYKTGDLVRWRNNGTLEYLGRIDQQVKLRGFRIELEEIEAALMQHPQIQAAAVVVQERTSNDRMLVAYVVSATQPAVPESELRSLLLQNLPTYMIPSVFVSMEALPLTPNGKLDRKALPLVKEELSTPSVSATMDSLETTIAAIWRDVLARENIGVHDSFFELGGHSLLLVTVYERLVAETQIKFSLVDLFTYPTIKTLAAYLKQETPPQSQPLQPRIQRQSKVDNAIAIVGLAGRFPDAGDIDQFWDNLCTGAEGIRRFSREELLAANIPSTDVDHPHYIPVQGVIDDADCFDASFFGVTPREAEILDPQHRVLLECAWHALEHAGYVPEQDTGRIGVYAGASFNTYLLQNVLPNQGKTAMGSFFQIVTANAPDFLTNRIAYKLNLTGPAVTVQTACSTSLVAVHMACRALIDGQCEMALAGGVTIRSPLKAGYVYREGEIMSPDGHCRPFDAHAQGTIAGMGVGMVVLKPLASALQDGDQIYAVIKGTAINNDGISKGSYTAPSAIGQSRVIVEALTAADVHPETIGYIEAHGTGTSLGDPIEIDGLMRAFREYGVTQSGYCAIGSLKANVGHLDAAAGVTGLIKTALALHHAQIPPMLHFTQPNPTIDFAKSPFYINKTRLPWTSSDHPRRAGISSFGVGGTNAHAILEEAPKPPQRGTASRASYLLPISARSHAALERALNRLQAYLHTNPDVPLADVAATLATGRKAFEHRATVLVTSSYDAVDALATPGQPRIHIDTIKPDQTSVFLFPGQGAQYDRMAHGLYQHIPVFRDTVDQCSAVLLPILGVDLRSEIFGKSIEDGSRLEETWLTQPALFVIEYALACVWRSWGIHPKAMLGHSVGEYVAACLAGVFSLDDALTLIATRGRVIQSCPRGAMLAVSTPESELLPLIPSDVSVAVVNGTQSTVLAGSHESIAILHTRFKEQGIRCRLLRTSHAYHSAMMEPALAPFIEAVSRVHLAAPTIPFISNLTGTWITSEQATDPRYWADHIRGTVRFSDGLSTLFSNPQRVLIEVGPSNTLSTLARQHSLRQENHIIVASLRHPSEKQDDYSVLLGALGKAWTSGLEVDWRAFWHDAQYRKVALPGYAFERQRHWLEAPHSIPSSNEHGLEREVNAPPIALTPAIQHHQTPVGAHRERNNAPSTDLELLVASIWEEMLGIKNLQVHDNFFELGGDSLTGAHVVNRLREILEVELPLASVFEGPTIGLMARNIEAFLELLMG